MISSTTEMFEAAAHLLVGGHRDAIGATNAVWLERRLAADDWYHGDKVRLLEMAPAAALPALRRIFDTSSTYERVDRGGAG